MKNRAPRDSEIYQRVREFAASHGYESAFRTKCMLLQAPAHLRAFAIIERNISHMLSLVPVTWDLYPIFDGWGEFAALFLNQLACFGSDAQVLDPPCLRRKRLGQWIVQHPMDDYGLTSFPIYSALCNSHEDPRATDLYALTQLHFLIARWEELEKRESVAGRDICDFYESYAPIGQRDDELGRVDERPQPDFAHKVRRTYGPALTLRILSGFQYGPIFSAIQPWLSPARFVESSLDTEGVQFTRDALYKARQLKNYCTHKSEPRPGIRIVRDEGFGGGPTIHGYVRYNENRIGTEYRQGDPDDLALNVSNQELISHWLIEEERALGHDLDPAELTDEDSYLLDGDAQGQGAKPEKIGNARSRAGQISIDKDRMPWSATHLRPGEIKGTLLRNLGETANAIVNGVTVNRALLQCSAIAVVCMETGRPLELALTIRRDFECVDEFAYIPGATTAEPGYWQWKAIEPLYRTQRVPVAGLESIRVQGLRYMASQVGSIVMNAYIASLGQKNKRLFPWSPQKVRDSLRPWLQDLDPSGRLTLPKLSRLQWTLLMQESGGDLSEASLVLALPHPQARVPLFYSLLSVDAARDLFRRSTETLWCVSSGSDGRSEGDLNV